MKEIKDARPWREKVDEVAQEDEYLAQLQGEVGEA